MIHAEHVRYAYRGMEAVLKDLSMEETTGHCLALLGNNGAGKSTFLKSLTAPSRSCARSERIAAVKGIVLLELSVFGVCTVSFVFLSAFTRRTVRLMVSSPSSNRTSDHFKPHISPSRNPQPNASK